MPKFETHALSEISDIRISNVDKKSVAGESRVLLCNYMDVYSNEYISSKLDFMQATATQAEIERFKVEDGDVLITKDSETPYDIGIPAVVVEEIEGLVCAYHLALLKPDQTRVNSIFLSEQLAQSETARYFSRFAAGSTRYGLPSKAIAYTPVRLPSLGIQRKIACIVQTADRTIEKTEALIVKYEQIKAGLMQDLFTRGIGPDGQLRPSREQAPELYQGTPIGWIPKAWRISGVSDILESLVDGPFGSNLKTEHYVQDPGVRVVRLQNVLEYEYNDSDRAYISEKHASGLLRNQVFPKDVLIAGLGEERFPVGRSCSYPVDLPPAVNKADCFRARCIPSIAINKFFMLFLNSESARKQIRRFEQGVTRPRINTGNLKRLSVPLPTISEQRLMCSKFDAIQRRIEVESLGLEKLLKQKNGLMHDLLTGKVPVQVEPEAEPEAAHV
ncbi:restriction endonuclease subunit S [Wenzhouxiangella sp. XN201]|uniref:restriction endonuclease subunit S n=1 Tax=Wenzhouxiangella sp. XN201 TaxID=2710755 RepID=UPI0013CBF5E9|nr:restriction endonuclease subunit S [Wenzhouxiangella sp. XN201]NEZ02806.1 restriction endonuclease subunit S [Wenzhouxiangella sp. XN201]